MTVENRFYVGTQAGFANARIAIEFFVSAPMLNEG